MTLKSVQDPTRPPLGGGDLACLACGERVTPCAARIEEYELPSMASVVTSITVMSVTRCDRCQAIHESADALLTAMPEVRQQIGARSIALHRVESALYALDALGVTAPEVLDPLTATASDVRGLLATMTSVGAGVPWLRRFIPVHTGTSPTAPGSGRWSHLDYTSRQALRDAYTALLARRVERPRPIGTPEGYDGCMLCGVGSFRAPPSASELQWTEQSGSLRSIGGARSPELAYGVTCPPCTASISAIGAIGQSAMSRAVVRHLGAERVSLGGLHIENLRGWATLEEGAKPNNEPWGHLDLSALRAELRL